MALTDSVQRGSRYVERISAYPSFDGYLRNQDAFIDTSNVISGFLTHKNYYALFRPRRSGKTHTLEMFRYFLDHKIPEQHQERLDLIQRNTLAITNYSSWKEHCGNYHVLYLDLSGCPGGSSEEFRAALQDQLWFLWQAKADFLIDVKYSNEEKKMMELYMQGNNSVTFTYRQIIGSWTLLTVLLERSGKQCVALIDEFDKPVLEEHGVSSSEVREFIGKLFTAGIKANKTVVMSLITGVFPVMLAGMGSGPNCFKSHFLHTKDSIFATACMFQEQEVTRLLDAQSRTRKDYILNMNKLKYWYNGYTSKPMNAAVLDLYNPVSVTEAIKANRCDYFWCETGSTAIIVKLLKKLPQEQFQNFIEMAGRLVTGQTCSMTAKWISVDKLREADELELLNHILTLLLYAGYLCVELEELTESDGNTELIVKVPNQEILKEWVQMIQGVHRVTPSGWTKEPSESDKLVESIVEAMTSREAVRLEMLLQNALDHSSYFHLRDSRSIESTYALYLHSLLHWGSNSLSNGWTFTPEPNMARGRIDILGKNSGLKKAIILELKLSESESRMESLAIQAEKQIHDRGYVNSLQPSKFNEAWEWGIAFWKRKCRVRCRVHRPVDRNLWKLEPEVPLESSESSEIQATLASLTLGAQSGYIHPNYLNLRGSELAQLPLSTFKNVWDMRKDKVKNSSGYLTSADLDDLLDSWRDPSSRQVWRRVILSRQERRNQKLKHDDLKRLVLATIAMSGV